MRISDWSSDVCSSDLSAPYLLQGCQRSCGNTPFQSVIRRTMEQMPRSLLRERSLRRHLMRWSVQGPVGMHSSRVRTVSAIEINPVISQCIARPSRSEEHTSELQSLMRISYAVFCLKKKTKITLHHTIYTYNSFKSLDRYNI